MNMRIATTLLGSLALAALVAGCETTLAGEEGNLEFSYTTVDDLKDEGKPVAVGARVDLRVKEARTKLAADVISASSGNTGVLAVRTIAGNTVTLEGTGEGSARIEVRAEVPNGDRVNDAVTLEAREPEVLKLDHHCADTVRAAYLVDTEVWIPFDMELEDGTALVGYGARPVDVDPADALTFVEDTKDQENFRVTTRTDPGTVTLQSRVDDATLELRLVTEADIDGAVRQSALTEQVIQGTSTTVRVVPTVGQDRLCCPKVAIEVETTTTDTCEVTVVDSEGTCLSSGFLRIEGDAAGSCEFAVTYPGADAGNGVTESFQIDVVDL